MSNSLSTLLALPYKVDVRPTTFTDGSPCYLAEILDLPGCVGYGSTKEEARASLDRARVAYITHHHEKQLHVPPPRERVSYEWHAERDVKDAGATVETFATA